MLSLTLAVIVEPVRVSAPVVFPAVNVLPAFEARVVLPVEERVEVVLIPPVVLSIPASLIVSASTPFDWIASAVLIPALVSLMINAFAVP